MTAHRDPDVVVAAWLDEGPSDLPDATRRAILTSLPTTPQARRGFLAPRRLPSMDASSRIALAVVVASVTIGGLLFALGPRQGVGPPMPSPTPSAADGAVASSSLTDTSTWLVFTSRRMGIVMRFPPYWPLTYASEPWIWQADDPGPGDLARDRAVGPKNQGFVESSQQLPAGMDEAGWWADYLSVDTSGMPPGCFPATREAYQRVTVDGLPGYLHGGAAGCNFTEVIVIDGRRAYQLSGYANVTLRTSDIFDRAVFDAWLTTVRFDPASADDSPVTSPPAPTGAVP